MKKKLLALLCAVVVFVTGLAGVLTAAFAEGGAGGGEETPIPPYEGPGASLALEDTAKLSSNFGPTSITRVEVVEAENTSEMPVKMYSKTVMEARISFDKMDVTAGTMVYVETPENMSDFIFKFYLMNGAHDPAIKYFSTGGTSGMVWYYFDFTTGTWTAGNVSQYGIKLPQGYKGYVYLPNATLADQATAGKPLMTEDATVRGVYVWDNSPAGTEVRFSEPIFVPGEWGMNAPTFDNVVINGRRYYLDPAKNSGEDTAFLAPNFAPTEAISGSTVSKVYNETGLPVDVYSKTGNGRIASDPVDAEAGVLFYVEGPKTLPDGVTDYCFKLYIGDGEHGYEGILKHNDYWKSTAGQIWYYFDVEKYCWVGVKIDSANPWGIVLPLGYKGYVYVPSAALKSTNKGYLTTGQKFTGVYMHDNVGNTEVRFSEPIFIKGAVEKTAPTFDHIVLNGKQYYLDPSKNPQSAPNYNIPTYTGAKENYKTLSFANVNVAITDKALAPGALIPSSVISVDGDETLAVVESIVGITKMPSFELTENTTSDSFTKATYNTDYTKYMGADAAMIYVKNPADKAVNIRVDWKFAQSDTVSATGTQFGSANASSANPLCKVNLLAKGATAWESVNVVKGVVTLPASFEGYIRYDYQNLYLSDDYGYALDDTWGLAGVDVMFKGLEAEQKVQFTAPVLVDNMSAEAVVGKAYVGIETKVVRDIFTGEAVLAETLLGSGDGSGSGSGSGSGDGGSGNQGGVSGDDYKIPEYTGEAQDYTGISIMKLRMAALTGRIEVGTSVDPAIIHGDTDSNGKPKGDEKYAAINSLIGVTKMPSIEMTEPTTPGSAEAWYSYVIFQHDHTKNYDSDHVMVYIKNPKNTPIKLRISWNWQKKDGTFGSGSVYTSTMENEVIQIMDKNTQEWVSVEASSYLFELPANFEGYIKYKNNGISLSKGQGKILDKNWGLLETWILFYELKGGDKIQVSTPILVEGLTDDSVSNIAFVEGETKAARNIFTGEVVSSKDLQKPSGGNDGNSGNGDAGNDGSDSDKLKELPKATTDEKPTITDKSKLTTEGKALVEWKAFDGAASYELRVFKNLATYDGAQYIREYELVNTIKTNETKADIADLELNMRYSLVVYALDANGEALAVYDFATASTVPNALAQTPSGDTSSDTSSEVSKPVTEDATAEEEASEGLSLAAFIAIIEAVALVVAVGAIIAIVVIKKRKA